MILWVSGSPVSTPHPGVALCPPPSWRPAPMVGRTYQSGQPGVTLAPCPVLSLWVTTIFNHRPWSLPFGLSTGTPCTWVQVLVFIQSYTCPTVHVSIAFMRVLCTDTFYSYIFFRTLMDTLSDCSF